MVQPRIPSESTGYNPISFVTSYQSAQEASLSLVRSAYTDYDRYSFWYDGSANVLSVLIQTLQAMVGDNAEKREKYFNLHNVLHLAHNMGRNGKLLEPIIKAHAPQHVCNQWKEVLSYGGDVAQNFLGNAFGSLRNVNDPDTARMMAHNELDFESLRKQKTAIFLIIPSDKINAYKFLMSLFFSQLFSTLMETLPKPDDLDVYVLMDEA